MTTKAAKMKADEAPLQARIRLCDMGWNDYICQTAARLIYAQAFEVR